MGSCTGTVQCEENKITMAALIHVPRRYPGSCQALRVRDVLISVGGGGGLRDPPAQIFGETVGPRNGVGAVGDSPSPRPTRPKGKMRRQNSSSAFGSGSNLSK